MATINKYNKWQELQLNGTAVIDWDTDTMKVMLVTSSYTPSATTHDYISDADANEVSGTNYTAGGATIGSITVVESAGTSTIDGTAW